VTVLRLPNPGSDLVRFVRTFSLIAQEAGSKPFDLDFMTEVMTKNFQASSMGAHGEEAVRLSTRQDRTRDPLFNQSKMYSELYRMLGWIRSSADSHSTFMVTPLGSTIKEYFFAAGADPKGLVGESFISAVFPNPSTTNVGILNHRPFAQLLKLAYLLGGSITRDEMIIGVLSVTNDLEPEIIEKNAKKILELRKKSYSAASSCVKKIAKDNDLQVNTLENYTRLPMAILGSAYFDWGKGVYSSEIYPGKEKIRVIQLTEEGLLKAKELLDSTDLRVAELEIYSVAERANFAQYGYYAMALRSGITEQQVLDMIEITQVKVRDMLISLQIHSPQHLIYNPSLQESEEVLSKAVEL
jgi:hypothetical protein